MRYKMLIIIAVIVLLAVYLLIPCCNACSYAVSGDGFSAEVKGDELVLRLDSNATTGYQWSVSDASDNFSCDDGTYMPDRNDKNLVGSGGITQFHITALKTGKGTLTFQYKRSWEGGETGKVCALTLEISGRSKCLQIDKVSFKDISAGK